MDSVRTAGAGKPKKVYVRKNKYPIYIVQLAKVMEIAWRKKAGFSLLNYLAGYIISGYNVSYLITLMDNKVPMDTYYELQDTENQMVNVMDITLVLDNLLTSAFLNASEKVVKISS